MDILFSTDLVKCYSQDGISHILLLVDIDEWNSIREETNPSFRVGGKVQSLKKLTPKELRDHVLVNGEVLPPFNPELIRQYTCLLSTQVSKDIFFESFDLPSPDLLIEVLSEFLQVDEDEVEQYYFARGKGFLNFQTERFSTFSILFDFTSEDSVSALFKIEDESCNSVETDLEFLYTEDSIKELSNAIDEMVLEWDEFHTEDESFEDIEILVDDSDVDFVDKVVEELKNKE